MPKKNLQVRLDDRLKKKAENIFEKLGIDTPTAIRIFFMKVVDVGGIPFSLRMADDTYSPEQIAAVDRLVVEAEKGKGLSPKFSSVEEALKYLHG